MSAAANGWVDAAARIAPFLSRTEPDLIGALQTLATTVTDTRREVGAEIADLRSDVQGVRDTLNRLLFAVVALLCAIISAVVVLLVQ